MQQKSPPIREHLLPKLLILTLLVALGTQLAHWTWVFLTPSPLIAASKVQNQDLNLAVQSISSARIFGKNEQKSVLLTADTTLNIHLKGVFAENAPYPSYAILNTGGKNDISVPIGAEILPGIKLKSVFPQHIVVSQDGLLKRINLESKNAQNANSPAGNARLGISTLGYNAYSISRASLTAALQAEDPSLKLGKISAAPGGGVLVMDAVNGSIAAMLGLQSGDILRQINGQFIAAPADLSRMIQQFQQASQIQLELMRAGKVIQLRYSVQQ